MTRTQRIKKQFPKTVEMSDIFVERQQVQQQTSTKNNLF